MMSALSQSSRVIVVPGFRANTESHWFPWLESAVPHVEMVKLPDPRRPTVANWVPAIANTIGALDSSVSVVTHSLGGIAALRAIASIDARRGQQIGRLVAVAPFAGVVPTTGDEELDRFVAEGLGEFIDDFDPGSVAARIRQSTVIRSDNDAYVPPAASSRFASRLGARTTVVIGAGHFMEQDGVRRLPEILDALAE